MRKLFSCSIMLAIILSLTACSDATSSSQQMSETINTSSSVTSSPDSESFPSTPDDPKLVPFTSICIDEDEVRALFEPLDNFFIADNFYVNIPYVNVLEYCKSVSIITQNPSEYDQEFKDVFEYIFPDRIMNEYALFYDSEKGSSDEKYEYTENGEKVMLSRYHLVKDDYDAIMSGDEGDVWYIYDENRTLRYGYDDKATENEKNNPVSLELGVATGYGYCFMEKEEYYDPSTVIATYPPNSTEKFMLSGEEVAICDAVQYYEDFVNNMPQVYHDYEEYGGFKETPLETRVVDVDVCQLGDEQFAYYFVAAKCYKGVLCDYMHDGISYTDTIGVEWRQSVADAYMIRKNDIEVIESYYRCQQIEHAETLEKYLPLETAVDIVTSTITNFATFEVEKVELIYSMKHILNDNGYIDVDGGYPTLYFPSWRFTFRNTNDNSYYICYVDLNDSNSFRYYAY